jgi:hypothetical protein
MVIHQMAARARAIDDGASLALDDRTFLENLQQMAAAMLTAPHAPDPSAAPRL